MTPNDELTLIGFVFLVLASGFSFELPPRRSVQYPFAFGAFALFLVLGRGAIAIVVPAAIVGAADRSLTRRRAVGRDPRMLLLLGGALSIAILAGDVVARLLAVGFPLAIGHAQTLAQFVAVQGSAYVVFVLLKELGAALLHPASASPRGGIGLYASGFLVGAPVQLAAHALYVERHPWPWALALASTLAIHFVVARQLERARRVQELIEELAQKQRLAAIGEVTARVLHHTRHQMGLLGMIAHQIARHLDALPPPTSAPIRVELARLDAVRDDLRQALAVELGARPTTSAPRGSASFAALVREQSALMQPLADERGLVVTIQIVGDVPFCTVPRRPIELGQAFLNVLENAIAAATREVFVELFIDEDDIVIGVSDDGPGMSAEMIARATEPFVTSKPGGSGMGLAITRAVVEEEEGELSIANRGEGGLSVRLRLPRTLTNRCRSGPSGSPAASDRARPALAESASRGS